VKRRPPHSAAGAQMRLLALLAVTRLAGTLLVLVDARLPVALILLLPILALLILTLLILALLLLALTLDLLLVLLFAGFLVGIVHHCLLMSRHRAATVNVPFGDALRHPASPAWSTDRRAAPARRHTAR